MCCSPQQYCSSLLTHILLLSLSLSCGYLGDAESTEPTKSLTRIAEYIDSHEEREALRVWFIGEKQEVLDMLAVAVGKSQGGEDMRVTK